MEDELYTCSIYPEPHQSLIKTSQPSPEVVKKGFLYGLDFGAEDSGSCEPEIKVVVDVFYTNAILFSGSVAPCFYIL